jgi:hypothetical protein
MLHLLSSLIRGLRRRFGELRATGDAGYSTETVVVTAVLVIAALTVLAIIVAKVLAKAKAIDLG